VKILTIVGNRPQFIKLGVTARRLRQLGAEAPFQSVVVNTGQHYDEMLSDVFFSELEIEPPAYNLGIGSGHIVDQIGRMMAPLREIFEREAPDALIVYGDTNSTVAGALVAAHLGVPAIHVEGGERLYRRLHMPEEVNRIVTDHLAELCLASSRKAVAYLRREGFCPQRVRFVGDPMYDIFKLSGEMLRTRSAMQPADLGLDPSGFTLCTIHRAENTDDRTTCIGLLDALDRAPRPVILPAHPRLKNRLEGWGWRPSGALRILDPLGYFDFQSLLRQCASVVTDSGGVGREAFFAQKPAVVPLESSAWIEAVEAGLATMTGRSPELLAAALAATPRISDTAGLIERNFGNGDAGERIVEEVATYVSSRTPGREGAWHSRGSFEDLPRSLDCSMLSHAAFTVLAERVALAGNSPERLILDVTHSLEGSAELADIVRRSGGAFTMFLDPGAAPYNPFASAALSQIEELAAGIPLAAADKSGADLLARALGREVGTVDLSGAAADIDPLGRPRDLREAWVLQSGKALHIRPWLWAQCPVSPYESGMRVADSLPATRLSHASQAAQG
jgi:UDP-N-acetylglucosamine 2-epimerase